MTLSSILDQLPSQDAKRLLHGRGGLVPGFEQINIEIYPPVLWIMVYQEVDEAPLNSWLKEVIDQHEALAIEHIYIQRRFLRDDPVEVVLGDESLINKDFKVTEQGLSYWVTLGKNQNTGLFLDMAHGRSFVREQAQGKRVLNLFSYTCSLGLSAAAGGAKSVVNIDMAKAAIKRGQQNFALNDLVGEYGFIAQDIFKMIKKLSQKGPYDLIIADPPSFQTKAFDVRRDYEKLLAKLTPSFAPGAVLMLCLNSPALGEPFLHELVASVLPDAVFIKRLENPPVLADTDENAALKVMLYQL